MKTNKECIIILGYTAIGKTTLAKKYKNVCDLESTPYKWEIDNFYESKKESLKGKKKIPNIHWPDNYINKIKESIVNYDYILIWPHSEILNKLNEFDARIIFIGYNFNSISEIYNRCIKRGNLYEHAEKMFNIYNEKVNEIKKQKIHSIFLNSDETLESYMLTNKHTLIKK